MRHRKRLRKLNRTSSHRKSMFRNMSVSLIENEYIKTTLQRAKELRRIIEPIITLSKKSCVNNKRIVFSKVRDREAVLKLFSEIGPRYIDRSGGYIRIIKISFRKGDNAKMVYIQLI